MIESISVHKIGNKTLDNTLILSEYPVLLEEQDLPLIESYFTKHFKYDEIFSFSHPSDINENDVFQTVSSIFENPETAHEMSEKLAQKLFDCSEHPKIKPGEFYLVYFNKIEYRNEIVQAIGLFKTEHREQFLKVYPKSETYTIEVHEGIATKKLDKGCLIFNMDKENGYHAVLVDKVSGGAEAHFWADDFLQLSQVENAYFSTENTMTMYRNFVEEQLPQDFEITRIDQADLLNRSLDFFKQNETFNQDTFNSTVLRDDDLIDSYENYKTQFENDFEVEISDEFGINSNAVKRQNRFYKSIIKLDKDFHIYVHGDRKKITREEDSRGKFYKIYFEEEK